MSHQGLGPLTVLPQVLYTFEVDDRYVPHPGLPTCTAPGCGQHSDCSKHGFMKRFLENGTKLGLASC